MSSRPNFSARSVSKPSISAAPNGASGQGLRLSTIGKSKTAGPRIAPPRPASEPSSNDRAPVTFGTLGAKSMAISPTVGTSSSLPSMRLTRTLRLPTERWAATSAGVEPMTPCTILPDSTRSEPTSGDLRSRSSSALGAVPRFSVAAPLSVTSVGPMAPRSTTARPSLDLPMADSVRLPAPGWPTDGTDRPNWRISSAPSGPVRLMSVEMSAASQASTRPLKASSPRMLVAAAEPFSSTRRSVPSPDALACTVPSRLAGPRCGAASCRKTCVAGVSGISARARSATPSSFSADTRIWIEPSGVVVTSRIVPAAVTRAPDSERTNRRSTSSVESTSEADTSNPSARASPASSVPMAALTTISAPAPPPCPVARPATV